MTGLFLVIVGIGAILWIRKLRRESKEFHRNMIEAKKGLDEVQQKLDEYSELIERLFPR